jgi:hypothetical protein
MRARSGAIVPTVTSERNGFTKLTSFLRWDCDGVNRPCASVRRAYVVPWRRLHEHGCHHRGERHVEREADLQLAGQKVRRCAAAHGMHSILTMANSASQRCSPSQQRTEESSSMTGTCVCARHLREHARAGALRTPPSGSSTYLHVSSSNSFPQTTCTRPERLGPDDGLCALQPPHHEERVTGHARNQGDAGTDALDVAVSVCGPSPTVMRKARAAHCGGAHR